MEEDRIMESPDTKSRDMNNDHNTEQNQFTTPNRKKTTSSASSTPDSRPTPSSTAKAAIAAGMTSPSSAAEIDFDIHNPPSRPFTPPSKKPICSASTAVNIHDVLLGRGGGTNTQIGNRRFRQLVQEFQPVYLLCRRKEKPRMARTIVLIIRNRGGRFLKKCETTGMLFEVGDEKAEAKTSQALREGLDVRATKASQAGSLRKKKVNSTCGSSSSTKSPSSVVQRHNGKERVSEYMQESPVKREAPPSDVVSMQHHHPYGEQYPYRPQPPQSGYVDPTDYRYHYDSAQSMDNTSNNNTSSPSRKRKVTAGRPPAPPHVYRHVPPLHHAHWYPQPQHPNHSTDSNNNSNANNLPRERFRPPPQDDTGTEEEASMNPLWMDFTPPRNSGLRNKDHSRQEEDGRNHHHHKKTNNNSNAFRSPPQFMTQQQQQQQQHHSEWAQM